jgi:hypothetical protein
VFPEVKEVRARLPFKLLGIDSDGGGEFINDHMYRYCNQEGLVFTKGRPHKKNDGCHIEQKNWSVIRQTIGYGRFETQRECDILNMIYDYLRLMTNFFMPSSKLSFKERDGGRIVRKHDKPKSPYQRVLDSKHVGTAEKKQLTVIKRTLNPAEIRREIIRLTDQLYKLNGEHNGS